MEKTSRLESLVKSLPTSWKYEHEGQVFTKLDFGRWIGILKSGIKSPPKDTEIDPEFLDYELSLSALLGAEILSRLYNKAIDKDLSTDLLEFGNVSNAHTPSLIAYLHSFPELKEGSYKQFEALMTHINHLPSDWREAGEDFPILYSSYIERFSDEHDKWLVGLQKLIDLPVTGLPRSLQASFRKYPSIVEKSDKKSFSDFCFILSNEPKLRQAILRQYSAGKSASESIDTLAQNYLSQRYDFKSIKLVKDEGGNIIPLDPFEEVLVKHGNLKRMIYERSQETLENIRQAGINIQPFMNLTDPEVVFKAVVALQQNLKGSKVYQVVAERLLSRYQMRLQDMTLDDIKIYSDEVASCFNIAFEKQKPKDQVLLDLQAHIIRSTTDGSVSFEYASRDQEDFKLGDKCGDCTAKGAINEDKVKAWIASVDTQFLKMYYNSKFIGRFNLVLTKCGNSTSLLADAIEFIPQAREVPKYTEQAKACCRAGFKKMQDIAKSMNISKVYANQFSNSSDIPDFAEGLGYGFCPKVPLEIIGGTPLEEVVHVPEKLRYYLQTGEDDGEPERESDIILGRYLDNLLKPGTQLGSVVDPLVKAGRYDEAARKVVIADRKGVLDVILKDDIRVFNRHFSSSDEREVNNVFELKVEFVERVLDHLYTRGGITGNEMIRIL